jgi:hypothetical protein
MQYDFDRVEGKKTSFCVCWCRQHPIFLFRFWYFFFANDSPSAGGELLSLFLCSALSSILPLISIGFSFASSSVFEFSFPFSLSLSLTSLGSLSSGWIIVADRESSVQQFAPSLPRVLLLLTRVDRWRPSFFLPSSLSLSLNVYTEEDPILRLYLH